MKPEGTSQKKNIKATYFPMVLLWFAYGFPMVFPIDFPLTIEQRHEFLRDFPTNHGFPMDFLWISQFWRPVALKIPCIRARSPLEKTSPLERATRRLGEKNGGISPWNMKK